MTQEEYLDKADELGRKHYNEYMALDMAFIKENRKADNGIIAAFKEKPGTKCGGIAKCTYKDLNVTIKNK